MAHYYEQGTGYSPAKQHPTAASPLVLRLPVVSQFYRILKDWQSEFRPRRYDSPYATTPIEPQAIKIGARKR